MPRPVSSTRSAPDFVLARFVTRIRWCERLSVKEQGSHEGRSSERIAKHPKSRSLRRKPEPRAAHARLEALGPDFRRDERLRGRAIIGAPLQTALLKERP